MLRRIAANRIVVDGREYVRHVVELSDGHVTSHYALIGEQPFTEWLAGLIEIVPDSSGRLVAIHDGKVLR